MSRGEGNGSRGVRSETVLVGRSDFRGARIKARSMQSCSVLKGRRFRKFTIESDENAGGNGATHQKDAMVGKANHRKRNETVRGTSIYHVDDATRSVETFRFQGVEMYERGAETLRRRQFWRRVNHVPERTGRASKTAVAEMRKVIESIFSKQHVPDEPRYFRKKQKNAQEAHEAIRPTSAGRHPKEVGKILGEFSDEARLYALIWAL